MGGGLRLENHPWWTPADAAEFALLTHELVRTGWIHREQCSICRERGQACAAMRDAYAAVEEWKRGAILRAQAAHLRARADLKEWTVA